MFYVGLLVKPSKFGPFGTFGTPTPSWLGPVLTTNRQTGTYGIGLQEALRLCRHRAALGYAWSVHHKSMFTFGRNTCALGAVHSHLLM